MNCNQNIEIKCEKNSKIIEFAKFTLTSKNLKNLKKQKLLKLLKHYILCLQNTCNNKKCIINLLHHGLNENSIKFKWVS